MSKFEFLKIMPSPTKEMINQFNEFYEIFLPKDFIDFLNENNGLIPKDILTFQTNNNEKVIERFLPMLDKPNNYPMDGMYDIDVVITQIGERLTNNEELIGMNIIPFAALFAGDFLCLDFRINSKSPEVVMWDHNLSEEFQPSFEFISQTFGDFLSLILVRKRD
jgi:hypothetical protein